MEEEFGDSGDGYLVLGAEVVTVDGVLGVLVAEEHGVDAFFYEEVGLLLLAVAEDFKRLGGASWARPGSPQGCRGRQMRRGRRRLR